MKTFALALTILSLFFCISCGQKSALTSQSGGLSFDKSCGGMNQTACDTYVAINQVRVANGVPALVLLTNCIQMAQDHAVDMVTRGFFSHDSPTETFAQRAARYGLNGGWVGENIARASSVDQAVQGWMNSSGHKANILNRNFVSTGLGYYQGHYVQCFSSYQGNVTLEILDEYE